MIAPLLYVVIVGAITVGGFVLLLRRRVDDYERRPRLPAPEDNDLDAVFGVDAMIAVARRRAEFEQRTAKAVQP